MADNLPPLGEKAIIQKDKFRDHYESCLVEIAQNIAKYGGAETVIVPHVNESLLTLKRCGLNKPSAPLRWWERHDFKVGAGSVLMGAAPSVVAFAKDIIESDGPLKNHPMAFWFWMIGLPIIIGIGGLALAIWGWVEASHYDRHH